MKRECIEPGCNKSVTTGHAIYRTSPKGEPFEGKCAEHYDGPHDAIVQAIEKRNLEGDDGL